MRRIPIHLYGLGLVTLVSLPQLRCHSGSTRELQLVNLPDDRDAAADGSVLDAATGGSAGLSSNPNAPEAGLGGAGGTGGTGGAGSGGAPVDGGPRDADVTDPDADAGPHCGDGNADSALDEECDDGNQQHSDGCENDCTRTRVSHIAIGWTFNCALSSGGGVKCWGQDSNGVLGRGTAGADIADPLQVPPLDFGTNRRVLQLSTSFYHSCVRFEDNKARCWGRNESGQLGNNTQLDYGDIGDQLSNLPDLPLSNVQSITAGRYNTCAVAGTAGFERLYCWGANAHGELGRSNTAVLHQPGEPAELNARPLASIAGNSWVCALLSNAARCWGTYSYGVQGTGPASSWLGDNEFPNLPSHNVKGLPVGAPTMLTGIANTMCALAGGDVYCWGRNQNGQTGYPVTPYGTEIWQPPRAVNLGDVSLVQISTGANANCGLDDEGFVRCWGYDVNDGSLGYPGISQIGADRDPAFDYQLMRGGDAGISDGIDAGPVTPGLPIGAVDLGDFDGMPGPDPATHVEVGPDRACAIMENGAVRCWGEDTAGLLGYGTGVSYIGLTDSPAQAYEKIGYADVKIFGPLPSDGGL